MRFNGKLLWTTTGLAALLSLILFVVGFGVSLNPHTLAPATGAPAKPTTPQETLPLPESSQWKIVTLGDSLTRGTGDANGLGYVGLVRKTLETKTKSKLILTNLAINGLQSPGLLEQLEQPQVKNLLRDANLIMFTIGGNDLFRQSGGVYTVDEKKLAEATKTLAANYEKTIKQIRQINKNATIVYTALYNPFGDTEAAADTAQAVLAWNATAASIAAKYPRVLVVPTYDLFAQKERLYLYTDHFHPNSAGYARIAERIVQALQ